MSPIDSPPSISAYRAPWAYVCEVDRWCDPQFRGDLANDLGDSIANMRPSSMISSGVSALGDDGGGWWVTHLASLTSARSAQPVRLSIISS